MLKKFNHKLKQSYSYLVFVVFLILGVSCASSQEGIFGPTIKVDTPWRSSSEQGIPLIVNVTQGDKFPLHLESIAIWEIDENTQIRPENVPTDGREHLPTFRKSVPPKWVILLRRDEGEKMNGRPQPDDSLFIDQEFWEIDFGQQSGQQSTELKITSSGRPRNSKIFRIFKYDPEKEKSVSPILIYTDTTENKAEFVKSKEYKDSLAIVNNFNGLFPDSFIDRVLTSPRHIPLVGNSIASFLLGSGEAVSSFLGRPLHFWTPSVSYKHSELPIAEALSTYDLPLEDIPPYMHDPHNFVRNNYKLLDRNTGIDVLNEISPNSKAAETLYLYMSLSYTNRAGSGMFKEFVYWVPSIFAGVWSFISFNGYWNGIEEFDTSLHLPLYHEQVLRIELPKNKNKEPIQESFGSIATHLESKLDSKSLPKGLWAAGDTHVHSRFSNSLIESGNGLRSTQRAATAIGLDWITLTDHANGSKDLGLDKQLFEEQSLVLKNLPSKPEGGSQVKSLLIQGEEIALGREFDQSSHLYHVLAYPWKDAFYIDGSVQAQPSILGFQEVLKAITNTHKTQKPSRMAPDVAEEMGGLGGFFLIAHPRERIDTQRFARAYVPWHYEDFIEALDHPIFAGMELWNTDETSVVTAMDFFKAHALELGRMSQFQGPSIISVLQMFILNTALMPLGHLLHSSGLTNSSPYWLISPKYNLLIDPREGPGREKLQHGFTGGHQGPWYQRLGSSATFVALFWGTFGIIDYYDNFPYRFFATAFFTAVGLNNLLTWFGHDHSPEALREFERYMDKFLVRIPARAVELVTWPPLALVDLIFGTQTKNWISYAVEWVEYPWLKKHLSPRFWERKFLTQHSEADKAFLDSEINFRRNEFKFKETFNPLKWFSFKRQNDYPKVTTREIDLEESTPVASFFKENQFDYVLSDPATQRWVELYSGIDLWDFGMTWRLSNIRSSILNLKSDNTNLAQQLKFNSATRSDLDKLTTPEGELFRAIRLVAAAGSDAHGAFNYQITQNTRFSTTASNYALGKVRTVLRIPEIHSPPFNKTQILSSLAGGSSFLTNGPNLIFQVTRSTKKKGKKRKTKTWPIGSVIVIDDEIENYKVKIAISDSNGDEIKNPLIYAYSTKIGFSNVSLQTPPLKKNPFDSYTEIFKHNSREDEEFFNKIREGDYLIRHGFPSEIADKKVQSAILKLPGRLQDGANQLWSRIRKNKALIPNLIRVNPPAKNVINDLQPDLYSITESNWSGFVTEIPLAGLLGPTPKVGQREHLPMAYLRLEGVQHLSGNENGHYQQCFTNPIWFVFSN